MTGHCKHCEGRNAICICMDNCFKPTGAKCYMVPANANVLRLLKRRRDQLAKEIEDIDKKCQRLYMFTYDKAYKFVKNDSFIRNKILFNRLEDNDPFPQNCLDLVKEYVG